MRSDWVKSKKITKLVATHMTGWCVASVGFGRFGNQDGHGIMSSFVSLRMVLGQRAIHFNNSIKRKTKTEKDGNPWSVKARLGNLIKVHLLSERLRYVTAELRSSPGKVNTFICCLQSAHTHQHMWRFFRCSLSSTFCVLLRGNANRRGWKVNSSVALNAVWVG